MRQDNTVYKVLIKLSLSSIGQDKSKLQKQISKLLILIIYFVYCIVLSNFFNLVYFDLLLTLEH